jgi:hypothetical protein
MREVYIEKWLGMCSLVIQKLFGMEAPRRLIMTWKCGVLGGFARRNAVGLLLTLNILLGDLESRRIAVVAVQRDAELLWL